MGQDWTPVHSQAYSAADIAALLDKLIVNLDPAVVQQARDYIKAEQAKGTDWSVIFAGVGSILAAFAGGAMGKALIP